MDGLLWVILVEYLVLGVLALYAAIERRRQRAAWNRLVMYVWTQHPVANLTPPTMIATHGPEWVLPATRQDDVVASRPRES